MSLKKPILMFAVSVVSISMAVAKAGVVSDPAELDAGAKTEAAVEAAVEAERAAEVAVEAAALAEQAAEAAADAAAAAEQAPEPASVAERFVAQPLLFCRAWAAAV